MAATEIVCIGGSLDGVAQRIDPRINRRFVHHFVPARAVEHYGTESAVPEEEYETDEYQVEAIDVFGSPVYVARLMRLPLLDAVRQLIQKYRKTSET